MAKQGKMTANGKRFMSANAVSPVVCGEAHGPTGGCTYWLKDGKRFSLNVSECRAVSAAGGVRWDGVPEPVE